ncbi:MAG: hypothetical protein DKT66_00160 [Candidatus Melainabacteria bacterium]|nr:MAG: hypothetical protein DKT66_00160 [Candidatus Melainabacteria bacterium]
MRVQNYLVCFVAAACASGGASLLYCAVGKPNVEHGSSGSAATRASKVATGDATRTSDDNAAVSVGNKKILSAANAAVGKKMWLGFGLPNGKLGCAAALSNILKNAGYPVAKSAAVVVVRRQLLKSNLKVSEVALKHSKELGVDARIFDGVSKPGDLIFGYMSLPDKPNMGPDAHCGVVGENGYVFVNDWNDGIWKRAKPDQFFGFYPHIYVIRIADK